MTRQVIERGSLAEAFKGTGGQRVTGLGAIVGQLAERPAAPKPSTSAAAPAAAQAPERQPALLATAAAAPRRPSSPRPPATGTPPDDAATVDNVAAYIDPAVLKAVRAAKRRGVAPGDPDLTYDELLLDAIDILGSDRIRAAFAPTSDDDGGTITRRRRRPHGAGGLQIQLRLDGTQQAQLAELVAAVGAPSRSAFVTTVFRLAYVVP